MTGRPKISSLPTSSGVVGENVHINCAAISIPEHKRIAWRYHGSELDDSKRILITFSSSFGPSLLFPYISPSPHHALNAYVGYISQKGHIAHWL